VTFAACLYTHPGPTAPPVCHPHLHPEGGCHLLLSAQAHLHPSPALGSSTPAHGGWGAGLVYSPYMDAEYVIGDLKCG
jgi:hypothetical protein